MVVDKVVLAYSGGLDTSVIIRWLMDNLRCQVITLTIDLGNQPKLEEIRARALEIGAAKALVVDARELFVRHFVWPALRAGAVYEGQYPLATALGRPLIAKLLVDAAREEGATAVAHGCTGKGNDQVRFDLSVGALAPDLRVIAPVREWELKTREEEIAYAQRHGIPVPVTRESPYSTDENLWGRSIESGVLEDAWQEPPEDVYLWTRPVTDTPAAAAQVEIEFREGVPVALDGQELESLALIDRLNRLAGEHGVGRIDHLENRLVGIKSREIYEAPAATVLLQAHRALEQMTLSKDQVRLKERVAQEYADLIYNGLWFTAHHQDLAAYVASTQRHVTGTVRLRLHRGAATVVGRRSPESLYDKSLATYETGDVFDQKAAVGFIYVWGLPVRVQAQAQLLKHPDGLLGLTEPQREPAR
ncbi:MAG: argininosuccinate synthase [Chloroflexi bacterium]|nr:argininosuccinate synthase [Chloroflexota bacterium]